MAGTWQSAARIITAMVTAGADSRKQLQDTLGLGKASISRIVDRLIRSGRILPGDKFNASARGRKATSLRVRPDLAYLIGTDLEGLAVRACVLDCSRRVVASARCAIGARWSVPRILGRWSELVEEVIVKAGVSRERIAGIGAGLPGVVARDGLRTHAYLPPGQWVDLDARDTLSRLGIPVTGANNVLCVAEYERRMGAARGLKSFLVILARYGIGVAMYGNGAFLIGDETFTTELGHMRVKRGGPVCVCGNQGCIDVIASGRTLPNPSRRKGPAWAKELNRRVITLGTGIANLLKVFHPPVVVLEGIYNEYEPVVRPKLVETLEGELGGVGLMTPEVVFGEVAELKASIGAAFRAGEVLLPQHLADNALTKLSRRTKSDHLGSGTVRKNS